MPNDGRHIDPRLGSLLGEAATMTVRLPDTPPPPAPSTHIGDTYYDLPVVKPAPWKWYIPTYFALGGLAGAASSLAASLDLLSRERALAHRLHTLALAGESVGAILLIADLGRPSRFHHMLRVFRPTSPMNLGTWILSAASSTTALSLVAPRLPGLRAANLISGTALSTYTGVLLGNTAIPLWSATRNQLPFYFAALSASSLASVLELLAPRSALTRSYAPLSRSLQLASSLALSRTARAASVAAPLSRHRSGALFRASTALNLASLATSTLHALRPSRPLSLTSSLLGLASSILARFALTSAGHASAADPRQTFTSQRPTPTRLAP